MQDHTVVDVKDLKPIKSKFDFQGKVILVTGASGGIGRSVAVGCAEMGADLIMTGRRMDVLDEYAAYIIEKFGVKVRTVYCEASDESDVKKLFEIIRSEFGRLDGVVSNAGYISLDGDNALMSVDDWKAMLNVNLTGMFMIDQAAAEYMRELGNGGSIVNMCSISGHIINRSKDRHFVCYPSTKGGILQLTRAFAADYGRYNIRVNSVSPGDMLSGIHKGWSDEAMAILDTNNPMYRMGSMDDMAGPICFLLSDLASFVNGEDLAIDGGYRIW